MGVIQGLGGHTSACKKAEKIGRNCFLRKQRSDNKCSQTLAKIRITTTDGMVHHCCLDLQVIHKLDVTLGNVCSEINEVDHLHFAFGILQQPVGDVQESLVGHSDGTCGDHAYRFGPVS